MLYDTLPQVIADVSREQDVGSLHGIIGDIMDALRPHLSDIRAQIYLYTFKPPAG